MPGSIPPEVHALFEEAMALRNQGEFTAACDKLSAFIEKRPDDFVGHMIKGWIQYLDLGWLDKALPCLRQAVALNPTSERASVCLFHCLWKKGELDPAFEEAKRFVQTTGKRSEEYDLILQEINELMESDTEDD